MHASTFNIILQLSSLYGQRIMYLEEKAKGAGVLCALEGLDIVQECRKHQQTPVSAPGADWFTTTSGGFKPHMDIDVSSCDVIASAFDPVCSFSNKGNWMSKINTEIKQSGGFTLSFWFKALQETKMPQTNIDYLSDPESMRRFVFFSSLSPSRAVLSIEFRADGPQNTLIELYGPCGTNKTPQFEDMDNSRKGMYRIGEWYFITVIFGIRDDAGSRFLNVMSGSSKSFYGEKPKY
jgi:hypothetical protein